MALARRAVTLVRTAMRGEAVAHATPSTPSISAELAKKQTGPWGVISVEEKKQLYKAAFSKSRVEIGKGDNDTKKVTLHVITWVAAGCAVFFATNMLAEPVPRTLSKEWKEATKQKMIEHKMNPINGVASKA